MHYDQNQCNVSYPPEGATQIEAPLYRVLSRAQAAAEDIQNLISRTNNLADKVLGCLPETKGNSPMTAIPNGALEEIEATLGLVNDRISTLTSALSRLESLA